MNCWICGNIASSEEHKFKSSLLRRHFGKKYPKSNPMLYFSGGRQIEIDDYKHKKLKFEKVICSDCNNNKTQLHDDAYNIFSSYTSRR
jgi:hypothetical protein